MKSSDILRACTHHYLASTPLTITSLTPPLPAPLQVLPHQSPSSYIFFYQLVDYCFRSSFLLPSPPPPLSSTPSLQPYFSFSWHRGLCGVSLLCPYFWALNRTWQIPVEMGASSGGGGVVPRGILGLNTAEHRFWGGRKHRAIWLDYSIWHVLPSAYQCRFYSL